MNLIRNFREDPGEVLGLSKKLTILILLDSRLSEGLDSLQFVPTQGKGKSQ